MLLLGRCRIAPALILFLFDSLLERVFKVVIVFEFIADEHRRLGFEEYTFHALRIAT
jgi:hypothetical protein